MTLGENFFTKENKIEDDSKKKPIDYGDVFKSVGTDIVLGASQLPRHVGRGLIKGVDEIKDTIVESGLRFSDWIGIADYNNQEIENVLQAIDINADDYIDPSKYNTVTGNIIEDISQFASGWGAVGLGSKALKSANIIQKTKPITKLDKLKNITKFNIKSGFAEALSFDEQEARLSNFIAKHTDFMDPIAEYLSAKENDSFTEGKFKTFLEGTALGLAGEALFLSVKQMKHARKLFNKEGDLSINKNGKALTPEAIKQEMDLKFKQDKQKLSTLQDLGDIYSEELYTIKKTDKRINDIKKSGVDINNLKHKENDSLKLKPDSNDEYDIFINMNRINTTEDIHQFLLNLYNDDKFKLVLKSKKVGTRISNKQTLNEALNVDIKSVLSKLDNDGALNASEGTALRILEVTVAEKLDKAFKTIMDKYDSGNVPTVEEKYIVHQLGKVLELTSSYALQDRTTTARALQARSIVVNSNPDFIDREYLYRIENFSKKIKGKEVLEAQYLKDLYTSIRNGALDSDQLKKELINVTNVENAATRSLRAGIQISAGNMLSSPRSINYNLAGGMFQAITHGLEKAYMSFIPGTNVDFIDGINYFMGGFKNFKHALSNSARAYHTQKIIIGGLKQGKNDLGQDIFSGAPVSDMFDIEYKDYASSKLLRPDNAKDSVIGKMWLDITTPFFQIMNKLIAQPVFKMLMFGDQLSKDFVYYGELTEKGMMQAREKGLTGNEAREYISKLLYDHQFTQPDVNALRSNAINDVEKTTLTNEFQIFNGAGNRILEFVHDFPALKLIAPFIKVPMNELSYNLQRTPLGLFWKTVRKDIATGGEDRQRALARMGIGLSLTMLFTDMAVQGDIIGSLPYNHPDKFTKEHTIKIDNKYFKYDRMYGLGFMMGAGAVLKDSLIGFDEYSINNDDDIQQAIMSIIPNTLKFLADRTVLGGTMDLVDYFANPDKSNFLEKFAGDKLKALFVPNIVADVEKVVDPTIRESNNILDKLISNIPGFSQNIPVRYNVYGEPIEYNIIDYDTIKGATGDALLKMFNPFKFTIAKHKDDELVGSKDVDSIIDNYFISTNSFLSKPSKHQYFNILKDDTLLTGKGFNKKGIKVDLSLIPKAQSRFLELRGTVLINNKSFKDAIFERIQIMESMGLEEIPLDVQRKEIKQIVAKYDNEIKKQLILEFPEISYHMEKNINSYIKSNQFIKESE